MSCDIPISGGKVSIKFYLNKKYSISQFVINWNTSEEALLRCILCKFVDEKVIIKGINSRNGIINAFVGKSGIMIMAPEQKFFPIINQLYNALYSSKVKCAGDYKKLVSDVKKGCEILITGKIKTLTKHLSTGNSSKIQAFQKTINGLKPKQRESGKNECPMDSFKLVAKSRKDGKTVETVLNDSNKYDLAIILNRCSAPFWFSGDKLCTMCIEEICACIDCAIPKLLNVVKFQASSKDDDGLKFLNQLFAKLYNFSVKGSNPSESIDRIKHIELPDLSAI